MNAVRRGFTLIELVVSIFVIGLLVALILPAVLGARDTSRMTSCKNNIHQLGLALAQYENTHGTYPPGAYGTAYGTWMVSVLPFVDQQPMYNAYEHNLKFGIMCTRNPRSDPRYNADVNKKAATSHRLEVFSCPADSWNAPVSGITSHNYAVNYGNTTFSQLPTYDGIDFGGAPFMTIEPVPPCRKATGKTFRILDIKDGLSNTMMAAELIQGVGTDLRGFAWWGEGMHFETYLPPNSTLPDSMGSNSYCVKGTPQLPCQLFTRAYPVMSASRSRHKGGVNVVLGDNSVKFVSNQIDLRVWRGMSTIDGGEVYQLP